MKVKIGKMSKETMDLISKGASLDIYAKVIDGNPPMRITVIDKDGATVRELPVYDVAFGVHLPKGKHQIELTNDTDEDAEVEINIVKPTV